MSNDKQLTIESTVKEEIKTQDTSNMLNVLATERYKPYKQNQLIDNTIRELANYKQLDIWGNAFSKNETRTTTFELTIENYTDLEEFLSKDLYINNKANQSAGKLLDSFLISMTQTGFTNPLVELPLKDYATLTGKKDLKELRKRTKADLQVLKRVKIKSTPRRKTKNNSGDYINTYLFGGTEGIKNGKIYFKFNPDFFKIFAEQKNFLYMPIEALQSNEKSNPHTYLLYKKVITHKRINAGKPRENIIRVKELYDYCISLPRYEDIKENGRQVNQRIIEPFERDLSVIKEFTWHYATEETPQDFKSWLETDVIITWNNEQPGIESIIEGREKHRKKVAKAHQKALEKQEADKLKKQEKE